MKTSCFIIEHSTGHTRHQSNEEALVRTKLSIYLCQEINYSTFYGAVVDEQDFYDITLNPGTR